MWYLPIGTFSYSCGEIMRAITQATTIRPMKTLVLFIFSSALSGGGLGTPGGGSVGRLLVVFLGCRGCGVFLVVILLLFRPKNRDQDELVKKCGKNEKTDKDNQDDK